MLHGHLWLRMTLFLPSRAVAHKSTTARQMRVQRAHVVWMSFNRSPEALLLVQPRRDGTACSRHFSGPFHRPSPSASKPCADCIESVLHDRTCSMPKSWLSAEVKLDSGRNGCCPYLYSVCWKMGSVLLKKRITWCTRGARMVAMPRQVGRRCLRPGRRGWPCHAAARLLPRMASFPASPRPASGQRTLWGTIVSGQC